MKQNILGTSLLVLLTAIFFVYSCSSDNDNNPSFPPGVEVNKQNNTAILLCAFGSTYPQPQATYEQIINDFQKAFPNTDIYISFSSGTIVSRVYAQIQKAYAQPDVWMTALGKAKYDSVFVQSLHIIPGEEYLGVVNTITKKYLTIPFPTIQVARGHCLLYSDEDIEQTADIIYSYYKSKLDNGEVVALMGHGNPDHEYVQANQQYKKLEKALQSRSQEANIFVGTVDWGDQMFSYVRDGIVAFANKKGKSNSEIVVSLAPLMSIAGDHAQNDLLGDLEEGQTFDEIDPYEDDHDAEFSWKMKLLKLGFTISPDGSNISEKDFNVVGLADHASIRKIWVNHLLEARKEATSMEE